MSFLGFDITGNALDAAQTASDVTSDNIANVNTTGASRQVADITEATAIVGSPYYVADSGQVGTLGEGSTVNEIQRIHDNSYDSLFRGATSSSNYYQVEQDQLSDLQDSFGEPNNGVNTAYTNLQTAISGLSSDPTSTSTQQNVLAASQSFVGALNTAGNAITSQEQTVVTQATAVVTQANTLITQIASLNGQIRGLTAAGESPNTALDERDNDIDSLSQLISVTTSLQANGSALVTVNGQALVNDTQAYTLANPVIGTAANGSAQLVIGFANDPDPSNPQPVPLGSGQLAAYADLYNNKLQPYLQSLNSFASAAANEIDRVTEAGIDQNGNNGAALLTPIVQQQAVSATNIQVGITSPTQVATGVITTAASLVTAAGGQTYSLTEPMNADDETVDTTAPLTSASLNNPISSVAPLTGYITVTVNGITPNFASTPPVQAFAYDTTPGTGNSDTIDDFIQNFNAAGLGVDASFDATSQTIVFTRDPNNTSLASRAAQGSAATTAGFTITEYTDDAGVYTEVTAPPITSAAAPTGTPATSLLEALGANKISGVPLTAQNAYGSDDNGDANALTAMFSQNVGIGALQTTVQTVAAGPSAGQYVITPPPPAADSDGAFSQITVGQQLTVISATTGAQQNVTVTAIDQNTGSITVSAANPINAGDSVTTTPTQTLGSAYSALVSQMALDVQTATTGQSTQSTLATNINTARQSVDGINLDEETQNLIQYQSAYDAAAHTLDVLETMLQTVVGLGSTSGL